MLIVAASLLKLLLAVLGVYLALKAIVWIARLLVTGSNRRTSERPDVERRRKKSAIRDEDIQDARYRDIDPES